MDINNFERARELRHALHAHPELSKEEIWTKPRPSTLQNMISSMRIYK